MAEGGGCVMLDMIFAWISWSLAFLIIVVQLTYNPSFRLHVYLFILHLPSHRSLRLSLFVQYTLSQSRPVSLLFPPWAYVTFPGFSRSSSLGDIVLYAVNQQIQFQSVWSKADPSPSKTLNITQWRNAAAQNPSCRADGKIKITSSYLEHAQMPGPCHLTCFHLQPYLPSNSGAFL